MTTDLDFFLPPILAGDTRAFAGWMSGAEATMRESLRSFATVVDVEAVLQESLLRVWRVAGRFEPDGRPNGLLRLGIRIARNLAISEVRRTRARATTLAPEEDLERAAVEDVEPSMPDPLLRDVLARCHERLPDAPRRALDARLDGGGGRRDQDLAEAVGMRLNTFLQNFGRARRLLAECLAKSGVRVEGLGS